MVTVARSGGEGASGSAGVATPSRLRSAFGRVRRRVQWWKILVGLVIVGLCVLGATTILAEQNSEVRIWVAEAGLQADQPVDDASIAERVVLGTPRFDHYVVGDEVGEWDRSDMVGLIPAVDVPAGSVLHPQLFHEGTFIPVPPGDAAVAVVVDRLHLPSGLSQGDTVLLVGVPADGLSVAVEGTPGAEVVEYEAVVLDVAVSESGPSATVTVAVEESLAADLTWLASLDRVALSELR